MTAALAAELDVVAIARSALAARALDACERTLVDQDGVTCQFSATGHEVVQCALGHCLRPGDAVGVYYRSRPLLLALGLDPERALRATLGRAGGWSDGRDTGVAFGPAALRSGVLVLPMSGSVGAQFNPAVGAALAFARQRRGAIAVACGGDGSVATGGFWAAINAAAVDRLPVLFVIEDNGFAISVPATRQIPGGDLAPLLAGMPGLTVRCDDGGDPLATIAAVAAAVAAVRAGDGPVLLRCRVPRRCGHSWQDDEHWRRTPAGADPLTALVAATGIDADADHAAAFAAARAAPAAPEPATALPPAVPIGDATPPPAPPGSERVTLAGALRQVLAEGLAADPTLVLLGQDIGAKGGVHGVTRALSDRFGAERVRDAALNEEGMLGQAVGMALAGLRPVVEIAYRKYLEPATEAFRDAGSAAWRCGVRLPLVLRLGIGVAAAADPAHAQCGEAELARALGWRVLCPSDAADAAGMLRAALAHDAPVVLCEHRALYAGSAARTPLPPPGWQAPLAGARLVRRDAAAAVTVVAWGLMRHVAAATTGTAIELIDLRCLHPWDADTVLASVARTGRLLVVQEDPAPAGLGDAIAATVAARAFAALLAPPRVLAPPPMPCPYAPGLRAAWLPDTARVAAALTELAAW